jgi:sec-independent protein translocase protein TatA
MGGMSWMHWAVLAAIVLLLFGGRGKISGIMGDAARGIRAFKDGLKEDTNTESTPKGGALPRQQAEKEEARVDS